MAHSIDYQIPLLPQTIKDEIEEGRKVDHLIDINGQDPSGSQTKKFLNQVFAEKFKDLNNSSIGSCTIFKVNVSLRESNPDAYTPKIVSIGPYHKKNPQLRQMEKYKLLYLQRFLKRKERLDVESCISELEKLKEEALKCYDDVETDEFCQMLLLDGCFVVEFIREYCEMSPEGKDKIININNTGYILRDLMLLENQLPFFVPDKLHNMTKQDDELPWAILVGYSFPSFVELTEMTHQSFRETRGYNNIKHLLDLVHKLSCHWNREKKSRNKDDSTWHMFMPNATELSKAGVSFAKVSSTTTYQVTTLFDSIEFENGLMKIPSFIVQDSTEILLRNLIAYEQQSIDVHPKPVSDFVTFMDHLIDSDKDVNLLCQKGILVNRIGEEKEVANLFNKIGNGIITYPDFIYEEEVAKAIEHYKNPQNKIKANFLQYYFSSPWVGASTLAAIILLILTAMQTILAFIK